MKNLTDVISVHEACYVELKKLGESIDAHVKYAELDPSKCERIEEELRRLWDDIRLLAWRLKTYRSGMAADAEIKRIRFDRGL